MEPQYPPEIHSLGRRGGGAAALGTAGVVYFLLLGGTRHGELFTWLSVINVLLAAATIAAWLRGMLTRSDRVDQIVLVALLFFLVGATASEYPRQSFDAATGAMAYAAVFFVARRLFWDPSAVAGFLASAATVAFGLAISFSLVWIAVWGDWLSLTRWTAWPPLAMPLPTAHYANRYDIVFLVLLLSPAVAMLGGSRGKRALRFIGLTAVAIVALVGGSRTAVLAALIASLATFLPQRHHWLRRLTPRRVAAGLAVAAVLGIGFLLSGLGAPATARLADVGTLLIRGTLWTASVDAWRQEPIFGFGPGSFPFLLQLTQYFTQADPAPPHPDNALVQALAESGIAGVAALAVLVGLGAWIALRAGTPRSTIWILTFVGVSSLAANPTDFSFLVLPLVLWTALAVPVSHFVTNTRRREAQSVYGLRTLIGVASLIVAMVVTTHIAARFAHDAARDALERGAPSDAIEALSVATTLDPALALYWREHGTIHLARGQPPAAIKSLERAVLIAPSDTTALRGLAIAYAHAGFGDRALDQAGVAVARRYSEAENLVTLAYVAALDGQREEASVAMTEALRVSPWLAAARGWDALGMETNRHDLLQDALQGWRNDEPHVDARIQSPALLAFLADRPELIEAAAVKSAESASLAVLHVVSRCRSEAAIAALEDLLVAAAGTSAYWDVRIVSEQLAGDVASETRRLARRIDPGVAAGASPRSLLTPGAWDVDAYGVRPLPDMNLVTLPTELNGRYRLLHDLHAVMMEIPIPTVSRCANER